jgi:NAD(P)-dependent dehydrogenase (short-subunit alcohol dehydrogenase family)
MTQEKWTEQDVTDQTGRVAIVTGSSSGIGYENARVLANKGAEVVIAVRNLGKGNAAAAKIRKQHQGAKLRVMELDLASLASVKSFADAFLATSSRLDLLINNAGVMMPPYSKTADGFELQIGTNHLGHFALTAHLLEVLANTEGSRVVNVASGAHTSGEIDFDDLNWEKRKYAPWRAYGATKIANLYFTYELDRKLKASGSPVIAVAAHPGWTATDLQRHSRMIEFLGVFAQSSEMGALPTLRAAVDPTVKGGEYFGPGGFREMRGAPVQVKSNDLSHDHVIAERLWEVSERLTGVHFDFAPKAAGAGG